MPDFVESLKERIKTEIQDRILFAAGFALKAEMIDRIFNRGENSAGEKIGDYSTRPGYFSEDKFIRKSAFKKQGKKATGDHANGKARRTMYLPGGYKELRDIQGRKTDFVNLKYSGSLEKSINVLRHEKDVVIAITDGDESNKRHGMEKHFGEAIFPPSEADLAAFDAAVWGEIEHFLEYL